MKELTLELKERLEDKVESFKNCYYFGDNFEHELIVLKKEGYNVEKYENVFYDILIKKYDK